MKTTEAYFKKARIRHKSIGIVGAQYSFGQLHKGVEKASSCIRHHGLEFIADSLFHLQNDYGDIFQQSRRSRKFKDNDSDLKRLFNLCRTSLEENDFSLFLGGDHSVGISTVSAVKSVHKDALVIWIDAHADLNTPESSTSNSLHGMPVSFLMGLNQAKHPNSFQWAQNRVSPSDLLYLGVRDLDPAESKTIKALGINKVTTSELKEHGCKSALRKALRKLDPNKKRPIHISFDVDSLDPKYVSATGVPVNRGLSLSHLHEIISELESTKRVVSLDFVELNPDLATSKSQLKSEVNILFQMLLGLHPLIDIRPQRYWSLQSASPLLPDTFCKDYLI